MGPAWVGQSPVAGRCCEPCLLGMVRPKSLKFSSHTQPRSQRCHSSLLKRDADPQDVLRASRSYILSPGVCHRGLRAHVTEQCMQHYH